MNLLKSCFLCLVFEKGQKSNKSDFDFRNYSYNYLHVKIADNWSCKRVNKTTCKTP